MGCVSLRLGHFFAIVSLFLVSEVSTQGQKKGFRGGDKSYGIKVEATAIGTNLQYKLPEAKAKSSSPTDWQVDNDNAEMLFAMNSPVLANVITTNPKFSVKGQWPAYKTTLNLPKGVKTGSKKNEFVKSDVDQGRGSQGEFLGEEEELGSGKDDAKIDDNNESGSGGINEGLENNDFEEKIDNSSGSGSAEGDESISHEEDQNDQFPEAGTEQQDRRSDVVKTPPSPRNENEEDWKDLSFEKVRLAVESLGHFNLRDERTSKALKDIIAHAKKVVSEAKMVLNDVASVVTSVRDFVNGNYNVEDEDKTRNTILEGRDDSGVTKAREEAEKAALQASYAAKRAQAASEMARNFANKIWNSAQSSRSLAKEQNEKDNFVSSEKNKQKEIELSEVLQKFKKVLGNKFEIFKIENLKKNDTQVQHRYGNYSATKTGRNHGNQNIAEPSPLSFMVDKQRGSHGKYNVSSDNKKNITKWVKGKKNVKNVRIRMKSYHTEKNTGKTRVLKEENPNKSLKQRHDIEEQNRTKADKNYAENREILKAAKVNNFPKNASQHPYKDAHQTKVLSQAGRKNITIPKMLLPSKHRLPGDTNEVVKITEALLMKKSGSTASKKDQGKRKNGKQTAKYLEEPNDDSDDTSTDDVNSGSDQSGSTISGSYDIELELEPEKMEFVKGEGKMNEKRIRIKDLTANGERNKVPPGTLKEILKAIKRVEGILGFTIEKTKTNEKKSRIYHYRDIN